MKILSIQGNGALSDREKTLFLCSKHTPFECYEHVFRWVESLSEEDCIMCFNSTEMEAEVLKALLVRHIPVVLFVMNRFKDRNNIQIRKALNENRMLIIELRRDEPKGKGTTPRLRNLFVLGMAQHIVCGYINKNGSIFPILAGKKNVTYLFDRITNFTAEQEIKPYRWTVAEDKTLLRMFYNDMGIHEIKKEIKRPYSTIRQRIRAITLPDDVLKGREFEDYVLELFDVRNKAKNGFLLKEWRSDKTLGEVCPKSNQHPDFEFEYQSKCFAVECKWRSSIPQDMEKELFPTEKIAIYKEFAEERKIPVIIALGIGGEPCEPESLYLIPLDEVHTILNKEKGLTQFLRPSIDGMFSIDEFVKP